MERNARVGQASGSIVAPVTGAAWTRRFASLAAPEPT
jgi:hypothetical protein